MATPPVADPSPRAKAMEAMNQAVKSARLGRTAEAERGLRDALAIDPELDMAWLNLGVLQQQRGRLDEAAAAFGKGMAVGQGRVLVELRFRLAVVTLDGAAASGTSHEDRRAAQNEALLHFQAVAKAEPERARAFLGVARCSHALEAPVEADAAYRRAIELDPRLSEAYVGLGRLYGDYGFHEVAIAVLQANTKVNELDGGAWLGLGNGLMLKGRPEEAVEAYDKAKRIDPDVPEVLFRLGMAHAELRNRHEAVDALQGFLTRAGAEVPEAMKHAANNTIARMQDVI